MIKLLTVAEVAKLYRVSGQRIRWLSQQGRVRGAIRVKNCWVYRASTLAILPPNRIYWEDEPMRPPPPRRPPAP